MFSELHRHQSSDGFSGTINLSTGKYQVQSNDQALHLDLSGVLQKKLLHYSKCVDRMGKSFAFKQLYWPDETGLKEVSSRTVSLAGKSSGVIEFEVGPLQSWNPKEEVHQFDRSVLDSLNNAILITESEPFQQPGPRIVYVNQEFEKMTGYSLAEIQGKSPRILQGPETSEMSKSMIRNALRNCKPVKVEVVNYRKDGTPFDVELTISPVRDETGWWTHSVAVQRDLAEEKLKQDMRLAASRLETVETMASGIAHDLNNQLATISNLVALTLEDVAKIDRFDDRITKNLDTTRKKLLDAQSITRQFMNLNRFNANINTVHLIEVEIEKLVQLCLSGSNVELNFRGMTTGTSEVKVDFGLLSQVVSNVVINSLQAFKEIPADSGLSIRKPRVSVSVEDVLSDRFQDQFVRIQIEDNGPGISNLVKARLFSPFVTTKEKGTGLGLFVSQANMAKLGGYLVLKRTSIEGTMFEIGFPRMASAAQDQIAHIAMAPPEAVDLNRKSFGSLDRSLPILLIDDQVDLAEVIAEILESMGLKVEVVHNSDLAFQKIQTGTYSLIVSDLNLGGRFVTDKIVMAAKEKNPEQRFAIISGGDVYGDTRMMGVLERYKDLLVFFKPFDSRDITKLYE